MSTFFGFVSITAICGTLLALSMMILVSLPHSPLRTMLIQIFGWVFAAFCALLPFAGRHPAGGVSRSVRVRG